MNVCRPVLRWHGGKWNLAPWVISHFPHHRCYVEPYGGAASILLRKPRSHAEIYNDLDSGVVNLFRVLRSDRAQELVEALRLTPFAREEFDMAHAAASDPVERARRLIVRSLMGFGSNGLHIRTGFRANSTRSGTVPSRDWANYPPALRLTIERLAGVIIENRDAMEVMTAHDTPATLHYVDPPYIMSTRGDTRPDYAHEMSDDDHRALLAFLLGLHGTVIISGYPSSLYDDALCDWHRVERAALADNSMPRTEVLWISRKAVDLFNHGRSTR
jgi:DNA adenine methylase